MRFIPIWLHIAADYLSGIFLIAAPWIFGWEEGTTARAFSTAAGWVILLMSLLTRYPGGVLKSIPFKWHLGLDFLAGLTFLAMGFVVSGSAQLVFIIQGVVAVLFALFTKLFDVLGNAHA